MNQMKDVRITLCTFRTATSSPHARRTELIANIYNNYLCPKSPRKKGQIRRDCERSDQKFRGVALALAGTAHRRFARLHSWAQEFVRRDV